MCAPTRDSCGVAGGAATGAIHVVCGGNELAGDDGVGIRVGRILRQLDLAAPVKILLCPALGFDWIDTLGAMRRMVIVDAARSGAEVGTCSELRVDEIAACPASPIGCHALGLPQLLQLARALDPSHLPVEIRLLGIEVATTDRFTVQLSRAVSAAVPEAVERVLRALGASADCVHQGRRLALHAAHSQPPRLARR